MMSDMSVSNRISFLKPISFDSMNFKMMDSVVCKPTLFTASNHVIPAYLSERFAPVLGDQEYFWRAATVMGKNIGILKQIPSAGIPRPQVHIHCSKKWCVISYTPSSFPF